MASAVSVNCSLLLLRQARWRDINCFFKVRAFERIGLIENSEHLQFAIDEDCFDGDFDAGNIFFNQRFANE